MWYLLNIKPRNCLRLQTSLVSKVGLMKTLNLRAILSKVTNMILKIISSSKKTLCTLILQVTLQRWLLISIVLLLRTMSGLPAQQAIGLQLSSVPPSIKLQTGSLKLIRSDALDLSISMLSKMTAKIWTPRLSSILVATLANTSSVSTRTTETTSWTLSRQDVAPPFSTSQK